ncbi:hypothetical protein UFOVP257_199 [uncultured Caudovirales phage]|uniref:Uncharacterized protein n=1 Tax=uncultured Caudovirales phage TaxID=2100421 RepID=A0A6J5LGV9_9CAUD|nr:hypothetical protein UFOVP257_199 [uncultured Caudovirales phage]
MKITVDVYQGYVYEFEHPWPRKDIESWCQDNCTGEWAFQMLLHREHSTWKFSEPKDAELFSLRWA